jgi:predicted ribosome quality control (RQC) complex YloA/Tae2 family protein
MSFQGLLRARMLGVVQRVEADPRDRVVRIGFVSGELLVRLFGRGGGLYWLEDGVAIGSGAGPCSAELPPPPEPRRDDRPPRFEPQPGEDWDGAARRWFGALAVTRAAEAARREALTSLTRELKARTRLQQNLAGDLARAEGWAEMRSHADWLAASLHLVPRGATTFTVVDPVDGEQQATVPWDPSRTHGENLSRLYEKASRLERAEGQLRARLATLEAEIATMRAQRQALEHSDDGAVGSPRREARKPRPEAVERPGWTTWIHASGQRLWIGRNDEGNHRLVFRHARGKDMWIHLRDRPSAHVVLPVQGGRQPSESELVDAARLLLHLSRVPAGAAEDLRCCRVSDLRPVPRGRPGEVIVTRERVLRVTSLGRVPDGWAHDG